ncbi:hypothetical protein [Treponema succinifaciens]|uniref:hypothetical protein n=1 Tax=Treponema succinifaciens TaxID=167 RepID=UPI0023F47C2C|nr:hypothetical protein [Treponema succinifaciens]
MGSRGQALKSGGFSVYSYKTLMRYNNTRFVMLKDKAKKNVKLPAMSNSKWAVYAALGADGDKKSISFYNESRKKYKEIDLSHFHNGMKPHVYIIDPDAKNMRSGIARAPTEREKSRIATIERFYKKHQLKDLYDNGDCLIYFWEWYNESTFDNHFSSFEDFESNAKIKGLPVVEILKNIDDADAF